MITKEKYLEALEIVKQFKRQLVDENRVLMREIDRIEKETGFTEKVIYSPDELIDLNMATISSRTNTVIHRVFNYDVSLTKHLTYRKLSELNEDQFRDQPNCGERTIFEIKKLLAQAGLTLKP
jgi:hypothetical protein